jgi:NADPH-dependent F420 reductase
MQTTQTIAIIGATGNMGSALAKTLSKGNFNLLLFARDSEKVNALVNHINQPNTQAIDCPINASWEADIIILAVAYGAEKEVAEKIREVANQKIVISMSNPLNERFDGLITAPGTSAAEELQHHLPHSKVVKAFNTSFANNFTTPVIDEKQSDGFIAGNHPEALETVAELVSAAGFNPVIAGDLSASRTLEQMQGLLITIGIKNNYNWLAGWKILHH